MHNWLRMLLLLIMVCGQWSMVNIHAQAVQDALYIFRNDGKFNAFYYGDIDHIEYSKIDTLGVEHDDYVTQEVYALDTLYRIPVSAIDSVAFVTPENKVCADVFQPDKSIIDYIIDGDSVNWIRLATNTPQELVPQVGQKLLIEEKNQFIPDGFGGRVILSELDPEGWLIVTEEVAISDIYERLVLKAAASSHAKTDEVRRYGILDGSEYSYVDEEPWPLPKLEGSLSLSHSTAFTPDGSPLSISGDLTGSIGLSATPKINSIRAFLFFDVEFGTRYDIKTDFSFDGEIKAAFGGSLNARLEAGFHKNPFKKNIGGLNFEIGVGLFVEGSIAGFELNWTKPFNAHVTTFVTGDFTDLVNANNPALPNAGPLCRDHIDVDTQKGNFEFSVPKKATVGTGLYAKAEAQFGIPLVKFKALPESIIKRLKNYTNKAGDSVIFKLSIGADVGGNMEFKVPLSLLDQLSAMKTMAQMAGLFGDLLSSQPVYKKLDEETEITLSAYGKIGGELQMGKWKFGLAPNASVSSSPHGLVPHITGISVGYDEDNKPLKPWRIKFLSPISRNLLSLVHTGFLVVDKNKDVVAKYDSYPWFSEEGSEGYYSYVFDNIDPGKGEPVKYTAYPLVNFHGVEMLADYKKEFTLDAARIDISQREVYIVQEEDYYNTDLHIEVIPNMKNVNVKSEAKWISEPFFNEQENDLWISWQELPEGVKERRGVIRLYGMSSRNKGEVLVEDSIVVTQGPPFIELSADSLIFDVEGGTKSLTILRTNLKDLKVVAPDNDKFITECTLNDDIITVTLAKSNEDYRSSLISVQGRCPSGRIYETRFWVKQLPDETIPKVDPDKLAFEAKGGNAVIKFHKGKYLYSGVYVSDEGKSWAHASIAGDGTVTVTVDANENNEDRQCYVICYASDKTNPTDDEMVLLPVLVQQEALNSGEEITEYIISDVYAEINLSTKTTRWIYDSDKRDYVQETINDTYSMTPDNTGLTGHWDYFRNEGCYSKIYAAANNGWNVDTFWKVRNTSTNGQSISFTMPDGAESDCIKNFTYDWTREESDSKTHWRVNELKFDSETVYDTSDSEYSSCVMRKYVATQNTGMNVTEFEDWSVYEGRETFSVLAPDSNDYIVIWVAIWKK